MGTEILTVDVLGEPYEQRIIELPDDDEGPVFATLVRRRSTRPTPKAVLYLHGYNDYFFQTHLADFFIDRGYDFYALDLRKYGRSLRPHHTPNFVRSIAEYFEEIDEAARIIRAEDGHDTLLLFAHSTGGLIGSLWAHARSKTGVVDGLILNSPFFDFNAAWVMRRPVAAAVGRFAAWQPYRVVPLKSPGLYGRSLHQDFHGEWQFDLAWKPVQSFPLRMGWLRAIRTAQRRLHAGLDITAPVLVAHSTASYRNFVWNDAAHEADAVLDVRHISRWASALGRHVTVVRIDGGKHDLTLSREPARQRFFDEADRWLRAYG
ncbi:alpha/beta hydrolase [Allorhizocola rhizosphaerae]|uniref:alpha/beta hydrolase n=1 Tax=Allorhizocola rhizosphaerae TaxID=1872709 RepID=UPI001FE85CE3|nr:alpha/beta hydrolase [Allorhizocola rhizosphaerae]